MTTKEEALKECRYVLAFFTRVKPTTYERVFLYDAGEALRRKDYSTAITLYERALDRHKYMKRYETKS